MADVDNLPGVPGDGSKVLPTRPTVGEAAEASAEYQQSVSPAAPPSRDEIEARLRATSDSISARLETLQGEMGLDGKLLSEVAARPFVSVALALGAGYMLGKILSSLGSDKSDGTSALADLLTEEVVHALDGDEPVHDAIQRVLAAVDRDDPTPDKGGMLRWMAGMALRSIVGQSVRELTRRFSATEDDSD